MKDIYIILIIAAILALAVLYIVKAKRSGQKCIGCPHSKTCKTNGSCGVFEEVCNCGKSKEKCTGACDNCEKTDNIEAE